MTRAVSTKNLFCMLQIFGVTASGVKVENKKMPLHLSIFKPFTRKLNKTSNDAAGLLAHPR
jgi:hypothetical protein